jgi:hypothetical protein
MKITDYQWCHCLGFFRISWEFGGHLGIWRFYPAICRKRKKILSIILTSKTTNLERSNQRYNNLLTLDPGHVSAVPDLPVYFLIYLNILPSLSYDDMT